MTTSPSSRGPAGRAPSPSTGNDSTSVGGVAPAVLAVELADPLGVDELDRHVPVLDAGGREREAAQLLDVADLQALGGQLGADDLDLEQG